MKIVVQRVSSATCTVNGEVSGSIGKGFVVFLGVEREDTEVDLQKASDKITGLRIFKDTDGKIRLSPEDVGAEILLISNFTLCGSVKRGRRPDFIAAAEADKAKDYYERLGVLIAKKLPVKTGVFGATMRIEVVNDGPVNIIIDTKQL